LYPYATRSRGIALFQLFGRGAGFFNTFVNPIGMQNAKWKYLLSYVCFLVFEIIAIYFLWPETSGRTLEELAFLFEDKDRAEQAAAATDKQLQHVIVAGENYRTGVSEQDGTGMAEKDGTGVVTIENRAG
jgi:hypothetical protein